MYYLNSRYYNPEWGRFINADTIVGNVGELLSHNMFAYCANNPVNYEDSNGYIRNPLSPLKQLQIGHRFYVVFRTAQTMFVSKAQDWAMRDWGAGKAFATSS